MNFPHWKLNPDTVIYPVLTYSNYIVQDKCITIKLNHHQKYEWNLVAKLTTNFCSEKVFYHATDCPLILVIISHCR